MILSYKSYSETLNNEKERESEIKLMKEQISQMDEKLKERDKIEDALSHLSDQFMILTERISNLEAGEKLIQNIQ